MKRRSLFAILMAAIVAPFVAFRQKKWTPKIGDKVMLTHTDMPNALDKAVPQPAFVKEVDGRGYIGCFDLKGDYIYASWVPANYRQPTKAEVEHFWACERPKGYLTAWKNGSFMRNTQPLDEHYRKQPDWLVTMELPKAPLDRDESNRRLYALNYGAKR